MIDKKKAGAKKGKAAAYGSKRSAAPVSGLKRATKKSGAKAETPTRTGRKVARPGFAVKRAPEARPSRPDERRSREAKPAQKSTRLLPKREPMLRKPAPRGPVDLGIGAVEIAPPKDAPRTIGLMAAEAAMDKKAFDIVVLDVRGISGLCDEMVMVLSAFCDASGRGMRRHRRVFAQAGRARDPLRWAPRGRAGLDFAGLW